MSKTKRTTRNLPTKDRIIDYWYDDPRMANRSLLIDACWLCGLSGRVERAHIVPKCDGGADDADNLHLLCSGCHKRTEHLSGDSYWAAFDLIKQDVIGKGVGSFLLYYSKMVEDYDTLSDSEKETIDAYRKNPELADEVRKRAVF